MCLENTLHPPPHFIAVSFEKVELAWKCEQSRLKGPSSLLHYCPASQENRETHSNAEHDFSKMYVFSSTRLRPGCSTKIISIIKWQKYIHITVTLNIIAYIYQGWFSTHQKHFTVLLNLSLPLISGRRIKMFIKMYLFLNKIQKIRIK